LFVLSIEGLGDILYEPNSEVTPMAAPIHYQGQKRQKTPLRAVRERLSGVLPRNARE
jgi:hypothetical protein